jgi:hypothetical protein
MRALREVSEAIQGGNGLTEKIDSACRLFAAYDSLRLRIYRECNPLSGRIQIVSVGTAVCLRFDEVGYFNRVYATCEPIADRLDQIETLYYNAPFGCELVIPENAVDHDVASALATRGWVNRAAYAFLDNEGEDGEAPEAGTPFSIREPRVHEREAYLLAYLRAFGADPARFTAATRNMRHLFEQQELHFLASWDGLVPAAIGMWFRSGDTAMLCAGATLPEYRDRGCHSALILARSSAARRQGCRSVMTWAKAGSQSHSNLTRLGMRTLTLAQAWHWGN